MKWIGLTGGIATGKTTVSKMIRDLGWPVVDADQLARFSTAKNSPGLTALVAEFGPEIVNPEGELDRARLGRIVFADQAKRLRLESILHPLIQELRAKERRELEKSGVEMAFYDVPLLFEKNLEDEFDATVLVYSSADEQRARLATRDGLDSGEIESRLAAQLPIDAKLKRANYVIFNHGNLSELKANVATIVQELARG